MFDLLNKQAVVFLGGPHRNDKMVEGNIKYTLFLPLLGGVRMKRQIGMIHGMIENKRICIIRAHPGNGFALFRGVVDARHLRRIRLCVAQQF